LPEAQTEAAPQAQPVVVAEAPAEPILADPVPEAKAPTASVLKFAFAQPSWVEVRDRDGRVIFSQKNAAGSEREVEGQPPFSVVIGNAAHVTLQYKGVAVDLSKRSKDDVARVTVE
jgi:cytoskeleton protein RodZ